MSALHARPADFLAGPESVRERTDLLERLAVCAREHGMRIEACSQPEDYSDLGIARTKCVDDRLLRELFAGDWPTAKDHDRLATKDGHGFVAGPVARARDSDVIDRYM